MTDKYTNAGLFDQIANEEMLRQEVERKLLPLDETQFEPYKQLAVPIEQVYLNRPDEDYTLRVRATHAAEGSSYTATLNNTGILTPYGLSRL